MKEREITIIIKTFLRINCVKRQLESIRKFYPNNPIIICDDSEDAQENKKELLNGFSDLNLEYIVTQNNIGLSEGRNILVDNVKTKYFLLCDDDFVFYKETDLKIAQKIMEEGNYDILGGLCQNAYRINFGSKKEKIQLLMRKFQKISNKYRKVGYKGTIKKLDGKVIIDIRKINYSSKKVFKTDICENFFIGKTEVIKKLRWYKKLKLNEHEDFFIRAKKEKLKIAVTPLFKILHYPETTLMFKNYRDTDYYKYVLENNNIDILEIDRNNVGIIQIFSINNGQSNEIRKYTKNIIGLCKKIYYKG